MRGKAIIKKKKRSQARKPGVLIKHSNASQSVNARLTGSQANTSTCLGTLHIAQESFTGKALRKAEGGYSWVRKRGSRL